MPMDADGRTTSLVLDIMIDFYDLHDFFLTFFYNEFSSTMAGRVTTIVLLWYLHMVHYPAQE